MTSPVVISRIQNRRGTQAQFDNLYPPGYTGVGGFGSIVGFNITNYPNVLSAGEIALCTDTRRTFIGNLNGEYIELGAGGGGGSLSVSDEGSLLTAAATSMDFVGSGVTATAVGSAVTVSVGTPPPLLITLTPQTSYTLIPGLTHTATPYYTISYSLVDVTTINPNTPGVNFSSNGTLQITSTTTTATLTQSSTDVNTTSSSTISFSAAKVGANIQISYIHNFTGNLTFSTSSLIWV